MDKIKKKKETKAKVDTKKTEAKEKATTAKSKTKKTVAEEKEDMKETAASKAAEKKVADKVTGEYKGKKVYTGPRGGK
ncbi:hypothetical protein [uncultured Flavobacterium sp.]|jgi:colicin import membrane protein|uniref:hypothetical protein n=1 Tax=uncultured Flavobacterium sp. TaxID=165435 RepID=UPI002599978B|nr:hypothetical protein [uncultured Flavobacterium sp.]